MIIRPFFLIALWVTLLMMWVPVALGAMRSHGMSMMAAGGGGGKATHDPLPWARARRIIQAARTEGHKKDGALFFSGPRADLVMVASGPHHPDMTFDMGGLTNPTISVVAGSHVALTLLNADYGPGMAHGLIITTTKPPYPVLVNHLRNLLTQLAPLPPRSRPRLQQARYAEATVHFVAPRPGTYYYLCPVPGHASAFRMYGRFLVRRP